MTLRSIRRFTEEPVSDEEVMTCIRAAVQAPNGGNLQAWQFLVVTDPETKRAIGRVYRRAWDRYEPASRAAQPPARNAEAAAVFEKNMRLATHLADTVGQVPVLVLVLMMRLPWSFTDEQGELDIGPQVGSVFPAIQNLMLAARAQGIGTALTTVYRIYERDVREICGIPEGYDVVALIPMGRPKGKFGVAPRRPAERVTSWNRFGERRD